MGVPHFTYEERKAEGDVRRKWFDVEHNSIPPVFYLPLYAKASIELTEVTLDAVRLRVARYERVGRKHFPYAALGQDVYEYKGDEFH